MSARHELDFSQLEPPEPIEKTLDAIENLAVGDYLCMLYPREPVPLFPLLIQYDMRYRSIPGSGSAHKLLVWRNGDHEAENAMQADNP